MFDRSRLPPLDATLLARTAEMLALPERVCRRRSCRRKKCCAWVFRRTQQPCCLANLDAGQRALFDQLAEQVRDVRDYGRRDSKLSFASPWRDERALQDAAVEITRPLLRGERLREFRSFAGIRETLPPAQHDGFSPPLRG
ncbi:hypothetical protein [Shinella sp.]|uniref:hypothetical protein n=1 Tax=Shinella sp. TaxID=1870904 RepID=UPI0039E69E7E